MHILVRHVLSDLLKVFLIVLTGLTVLIFVVLAGKEAVDKGIGLGPLLKMTPYLLPQALQFAVPGTMLLATTYVYGRMSSDNELVAIKSLGISPMVLIWPTLALATLVSFAALALNDLAVSWGTMGMQRVFIESLEEVAYSHLRMQNTYSSGKLSILVRGVEGRKLIQPTLVVQASGDRPALTVSAEEAELRSYPERGELVFRFHNFEVNGPVKVTNPDTYEQVLSLDELTGVSSQNRSPSTFALSEIGPAVVEQITRLEQMEQATTATTAFAMMTGDFDSLSNSAWQVHRQEIAYQENRLHRLHTEPWRRWANGFSCLCFVLIGAPMAIRLRHAEFLASFFACFLPILIVYYPLLAVSVDQAKDGAVPPPAVWLGNFVLAIWGVWLLRRVIRY
jgi:lipopolysaccharide export system permease protein